MQGQSARRQQRGLSLLAGKRLALVKSRIGCCLAATVPTTIPVSPTWERIWKQTPCSREGEAGTSVPPQVGLGPYLALLLPLLSQFPAGKREIQQVEGQSPGGGCGCSGTTSVERAPSLRRRLAEGPGGKIVYTLPFGIPGAWVSPGGTRAIPGSPFPRNGWRGCPFLQSSSSWQPPGCQGLLELALAVSMATVGALAPSSLSWREGGGLDPAALEPRPQGA